MSEIKDREEVELLRKELADVSAFVRERVEPAHEERVRLRKAIEALTSEQREGRRSGVLEDHPHPSPLDSGFRRNDGNVPSRERGHLGGGHPLRTRSAGSRPGFQSLGLREGEGSLYGVVRSGPYAGCDVLDLAIMRSMQRAAASQMGPDSVREWGIRLKAAMDSVTAGKGDEIVPSGMSYRLWEDVHQETKVAGLFNRIDMPTNPFDIPLQLGDVNWYPGTENTAVAESTPKTAKQTLTAYELVAEVPWSLTLEEDAVFAVLPEVRRTLVRNAAEVIDDVLLNADMTATNNINADSTTITTSTAGMAQYLIGFNGLLHLPLVENTGQSKGVAGEITAAGYLDLLKKLGKYGVNARETVFITDVATFVSSLGISAVETVDKLGPQATILTGQLATVYGHPLIVSGQMKLADADGKVTDGGNDTDRGRVLCVNTSQWRVGFRRHLMIDTERDIQKRQNLMVVSMRLAFADRTGDPANAEHTALAYNISH